MSNQSAGSLILGTAGHIDHGKSALVLALTGTDPDRLAEEKKRGITIELGFAQLQLPDGRSMGVVDVPGHEKFVRQMIAGATGIDVALLVIAADDGIMPQTVEHVAVLQTLGVRSCVVALTKTDLVDAEWVDFVRGEVQAFLQPTPYAGCAIVAVSSKTGAGVEDVRAAIAAACSDTPAVHQGTCVRQPVDRVFAIKGSGTVVTGTLWSGTVAVGDTVEILPSGLCCRVRSVQMHDTPVDAAPAGNRVALNLNNVKTSEVHPGDFIAAPGLIEPTDRFDCALTYQDTAASGKPLASGVRMHIAHGTREVLGRVLLADGLKQLAPGQSSYAQVRLEESLPVSYGDRFVMRTYSPVHMAGGGQVLQAHPRHRTNLHGESLVLDALAAGDVQAAAECALGLQKHPVAASALARLFGVEPAIMQDCLDQAVDAKRALALGASPSFYTTQATLQRCIGAIERALVEFHAASTEAGMPKDALRQQCFARMDPTCFDCLVDQAVKAKAAVVKGGLVGHPSAQAASQAMEESAAQAVLDCLAAHGMTPPDIAHLAQEADIDAGLAKRVLQKLAQQGAVFRASADWYFDQAAIQACQQRMRAHLQAGGDGTVAGLKDAMGTSRKYAVPLLEAFDAQGFTVRTGDVRSLR